MSKLSGFIIRLTRRALRLRYGFEKWHISSLDQRQYAIDIIAHCNQRPSRKNCVEIGCGLADIIRNMDYGERLGLDMDQKVLKAARFLSREKEESKLKFDTFIFPDNQLSSRYDVIIMVNWIHHIEPSILKNKISEFIDQNLNAGGELIIDTVQDPEYQFNHDINFLVNGLNCSLIKLGDYPRQREIWAIRKLN